MNIQWLSELMERSITVESIINNPWGIGIGCFLFYLLGGKLYTNWLTTRWAKQGKNLESTSDFGHRDAIYVNRVFFPLSAAIYAPLFLIGSFFKNQGKTIDRIKEKHSNKND